VWWYIPVILALWRLGGEDLELEANLSNSVGPYVTKKKKKKKKYINLIKRRAFIHLHTFCVIFTENFIQGWLETHYPPASSSRVLELQVCTTTPG
jgi:hypothetical protein